MTLAEVLLWKQLKGKQLCGYDFDRQKPIGRRIVDFFCKELALAVDVDGSVHDHTRERDEQRHQEIEGLGVTHLRFWNFEVKNNVGSTIKRIEEWIRAEEQRRGWPGRQTPVKVRRSRLTRNRRPTPDPSNGGELPPVAVSQIERPSAVARANASSLLRRGRERVCTANIQ